MLHPSLHNDYTLPKNAFYMQGYLAPGYQTMFKGETYIDNVFFYLDA